MFKGRNFQQCDRSATNSYHDPYLMSQPLFEDSLLAKISKTILFSMFEAPFSQTFLPVEAALYFVRFLWSGQIFGNNNENSTTYALNYHLDVGFS